MNIISTNNGQKLNIDKKETYRYLGYHFGGEVPLDEELEKMVLELTEKLKEVITPRCAYELFQLEVEDNTCHLSQFSLTTSDSDPHRKTETSYPVSSFSDSPILSIESKKLSNHLKGCRQAILFAATIGPGADMMIRRYSGRSTIKPAILQAVGAAAIEAFADDMTEYIRSELSKTLTPDTINHQEKTLLDEALDDKEANSGENLSDSQGIDSNDTSGNRNIRFKMRFSPGYGDFSLTHQTDFFRLLQLEKNLGMSLNSALLMSPSKSITAVIGVL